MIEAMQAYLAQNNAIDPPRQALMFYAQILDREALVMTFNDQFLTLGIVIGLSAFAMLALRRRQKPITALASAPEEPALAH